MHPTTKQSIDQHRHRHTRNRVYSTNPPGKLPETRITHARTNLYTCHACRQPKLHRLLPVACRPSRLSQLHQPLDRHAQVAHQRCDTIHHPTLSLPIMARPSLRLRQPLGPSDARPRNAASQAPPRPGRRSPSSIRPGAPAPSRTSSAHRPPTKGSRVQTLQPGRERAAQRPSRCRCGD